MVFEFDYVPLAIARINQFAPGYVAPDDSTFLPATPPESMLLEQIVPRLDLEKAIPVWNQDQTTIENERSSPLLRLPAELKLKIWSMVYEDVTIHMTSTVDGRVGHFICDEKRNPMDHDDAAPPLTDLQYMQCRCRGSLLEPPYTDAPDPNHVKRRRESMPETDGLQRIGGMLLACREIYANARDYLWSQPNFVFPTQRLLPRFAASIHPEQLTSIRHITIHTWTDSWRTMSANGFFGGSADHAAPVEWESARSIITNTLVSLVSCHLIVHVAGGDSTIWHDECKPAECVRGLDAELEKCGRRGSVTCQATAAIESSRYGPGAVGSWVTYDQVKGLSKRPMMRERNVGMLQELELMLPQGWRHAWWVSMEERDQGQEAAGPKPWPIVYNHAY